MEFKKIQKISKGWSSYIWKIKLKNNKMCVLKEVREKSNRKDLANREGKYLSIANSIGVGPKLIEVNHQENYVVMEFIEGEIFLKWIFSKEFDKINKKELYELIKELFRQCKKMDEIGLSHKQLQVGKNIIVTKKTIKGKNKFKTKNKFIPTIIDFEKSSFNKEKTKEKNFGQLASFLFYNPNGAVAKKIREKLNLKL